MNESNNNEQFDENAEYQFTDSPETPVYKTTKPKSSFSSMTKRKKIMMGVVLALLVFGGYRMMGGSSNQANNEQFKAFKPPVNKAPDFSANTKTEQQQALAIKKQQAALAKQQEVAVEAAAKQKAKLAAEQAAKTKAVASTVELSKKNAESLKSLQDQVSKQVTSSQSNATALRSDIADLAGTVKALSAQVTKLQASMTSLAKKQKQMELKRLANDPVHANMYVQAVVPGRAWLKNASGKTSTVSVGTKVKGFGVVTSINPANGTVATSSGQVIRYAIDN